MLEFFQINICILICMCMLCFVAGGSGETIYAKFGGEIEC